MSLANVISADKTLPGGKPSPFPAMYWKPDGSSYIAASEAEVQPDSTPYHPDDAADKKQEPVKQEKPPQVGATALTRAEVISHLEAGGIRYDPRAKDKVLYALLLEAIKNALTAAEVPFDAESTDAPALLELLPKE